MLDRFGGNLAQTPCQIAFLRPPCATCQARTEACTVSACIAALGSAIAQSARWKLNMSSSC